MLVIFVVNAFSWTINSRDQGSSDRIDPEWISKFPELKVFVVVAVSAMDLKT